MHRCGALVVEETFVTMRFAVYFLAVRRFGKL